MEFGVLGSLPGNTSTNVPVETGIEIYFTHREIGDISKYFNISPAVEGTFEQHGHAVVFVPKEPLEYGTLYTVTIKKGLPLEGSDQTLAQDYSFSFETNPKSVNEKEYTGHFYYRNIINEFAPTESMKLPFNFYLYYNKTDNNTSSVKISTAVYAYKDVDSFINAIGAKESIPYWAYYSWQNNSLKPDKLQKVTEFTQDFPVNGYGERFIDLPKLSEGYYLVESTWDDISFQTLVQVTDIGMYIADSDTKTLVWLNSIEKDAPIANATIEAVGKAQKHSTNADGVAIFDTQKPDTSDQSYIPNLYFKISAPDGKTAVLPCYSYAAYSYYRYGSNLYWRYFQTDRSLYKPTDKVEYWGFIKDRYVDENVEELTVEIGQGYWFWSCKSIMSFFRPYIGKPLVSDTIKVKDGFYQGSFELPDLEPGGYQVSVKYKGEVVNSYYINVENYVKPAYTMTVSKDKEAIFEGETVNFTMNTSFFEGTPVSDLEVRYSLSSLSQYLNGTSRTDVKGQVSIPYTPRYNEQRQGETGIYMNASATLPESGEINGNAYVRMFINDINVALNNEYKDGKSTITAQVNKIDLSRINAGTAEDCADYLGDAVPGKTLTGRIIRHTYVKIEDGQYYDFINKVVQKRYRYEERKSDAGSFTMVTGAEGKAAFEADLPQETDVWYTAEINCTDGWGKPMKFDVYLSSSYWRYDYYRYEGYHLDSEKEKYKLGENVELSFNYGEDALPKGSYLFIESQNGIRDYSLSGSSQYLKAFEADMVPNYYVNAVYFNGSTYVSDSCNVVYDYEERKIDITAVSDKESYKPGEDCIVKIKAVDQNGKPVPARVNFAIVDEAMYKISGQYINVLEELYSWVGSGISYTYASHYNSNNTGVYGQRAGGIAQEKAMYEAGAPVASTTVAATATKGSNGAEKDSASFEEAYVRKEFKDTAYFKSIILNEKGEGEIKFKLPDNVTSWRVTLAGISPTLYGGTGEADLKVTLPFFMSNSMNTVYLVGDEPYIGVTAYGTSLKEGDLIKYQLTCPQLPELELLAEGKAFERVNLALWKLEEGSYDIIVKALSPDGSSDGFSQPIKVVTTFHEIEVAEYSGLELGTSVKGGTGGMTTLLFSDEGRGKYLPALYNLAYSGGNRVDQKYVAQLARDTIRKYFAEVELWGDDPVVQLSDYANQDGGFGILPYAESDLRTTALLASLIGESSGKDNLKQYFYSFVLSEDGTVSPAALYGLAALGEPVLLELDRAAKVENLKTEDYIFLALAYAQLGEKPKADKIFVDRLGSMVDESEPYARLLVKGNTDTTLQYTALTSVLMSALGRSQKDGMFAYINDNWSKEVLINLEKLMYIRSEIDKAPAASAEFTYTYEDQSYTEKLENGSVAYLKIPSLKVKDLKIVSVSGNVGVVSVYNKKLTQSVIPDENLTVSRQYFDYTSGMAKGTFEQNDIVKVVINWSISKDAIDSGYEITDYCPAGLKPIESPWQMGLKPDMQYWYYRNIEGQKVTLYVSKHYQERTPFVYYARVVNPGVFKAEAPIIQGTVSRDSLKLGNTSEITVNP
ncbi:MAG: alpha-2-macroglobulin family protein [Eubacteriales bacterium]|nr:alpha-2-macroglobulin family protein [Eubacteriales bacterium]